MHIVYIISAYKLPYLLVRLVHRLQSGNATFFIHVDKKTPLNIFKQMTDGLQFSENVYFLKRHNCYWGDFGHVEASLQGIEELLKRDIYFDYAVLLTGQDYPLKKNDDIETFFEKNNDYSFIKYASPPDKNWVGDRLEYWHYHIFGKHIRFPMDAQSGKFIILKKLLNLPFSGKRESPPGLDLYGGSSYWNLSREAIYYISDYVDRNPDFVRFFRRTYISDEFFFQTILLNSHLKEKIVNDDLRHIDWSGRYGAYPTIFRKDDFNELRSSSKLFARKFDSSVDSDVLDMLDEKASSSARRPS